MDNPAEKIIKELQEEIFYLEAENEYLKKDIEQLNWQIEDSGSMIRMCILGDDDE